MKTQTSISLGIGITLFLVGVLSVYSQSAPKTTPHIGEAYQQRLFDTPYGELRRWNNNALISFQPSGQSANERILVYDQYGKISREATVSFPNAEAISLSDVTLNGAGALIASGGTRSTQGNIAQFIAQLNETGQVTRVIRTTPFIARRVCVAKDDGTVWAYGGDLGGLGNSAVLEQYSFDKGLLKALFPRTELGREWLPLEGQSPDQIRLACTAQKVVLFNAISDVLLEYDLTTDQATKRKMIPLPGHKDLVVTGFCTTEDGMILASLFQKTHNPPMTGVYQLTFENQMGHWTPLEETVHPARPEPDSDFRVVGVNVTDIIYSRSFGDRFLTWAKLTR
jgi:hypothetical protein